MIKIVAVCGAGVGSSVMLRYFIQNICDSHDIDAMVETSDIGSVNPEAYDVLITTSDFADLLRDTGKCKIIRLDNLMDKGYLENELLKAME
ncbi:PTS sugar transporter subunit IIB [Clostridiales bacterium COT073_COT-073]|nr:PTS sugar transporter subunit IIB [Clostridiales bacterium COT073_COT-073]